MSHTPPVDPNAAIPVHPDFIYQPPVDSKGAGLKITYNPNEFRLVVEDTGRALWLDGSKLYYDMPKDYRPEINPFDLEDAMQAYYQLYRLAKDSYGLNEVPQELVEALEILKQLADVLTAYSYHILGIICKPEYKTAPRKANK